MRRWSLCVSGGVGFAVMLWLQQPVGGPAEAYTKSENAELVIPWLIVGPVVLSPVFVFAGYLGGRFGPPLLRRIAER